jgi:hypothetical protein
VVVVSAFATAAPAAAAAEAPPGALPLPAQGSAVIASATERVRYVLEGSDNLEETDTASVPLAKDARPGDSVVLFSDIRVPASCTSAHPLRIGVYNPEGRFMRRIQPDGDGSYRVVVPRVSGGYGVKLGIDDPACAGLSFEITLLHVAGSSDIDKQRCRALATLISQTKTTLHKARVRERKARPGRPRTTAHKLVVAKVKALTKFTTRFAAKKCRAS